VVNPYQDDRGKTKKAFIDHNYGPITYEAFRDLYVEQGWSLPDFQRELGFPFSTTQWLCEHFAIPRRSIKQAVGGARRKAKQTNLERYGVENPSQAEEIKEKKAATFLRNYGASNIFATAEFKEKHAETMLARYGKGSLSNRFGGLNRWWDDQTEEYRSATGARLGHATKQLWSRLSECEKQEIVRKRLAALRANGKPRAHYASKLEDSFGELLEAASIVHSRQYWFKQRSFDFRIDGTNILIEVQGDYWHANPEFYAEEDIIPSMSLTAREVWDRDDAKRKLAEEAGFQVHHVWETEIKKHPVETLLRVIKLIDLA
jgi:G:T-mismatch repair DNA endonuclease (very short patch repair protein)